MPFKSKSQQRWMFAAESRGELPEGTAKKWADHTPNIKKLPEHVKKASGFLAGFMKMADPSMSMEANDQSGWSIGDSMPGTELRNNAETGQFQGKSYRTQGVQNENREMKQSLKQKAQTARGGNHYGETISKGISPNRQD